MKVNAVKCPKCGDIIYSRAHYDFRSCSCDSVHIDGGFEYVKVGYNPDIEAPPEVVHLEVDATKAELYFDWRSRANSFGVIHP